MEKAFRHIFLQMSEAFISRDDSVKESEDDDPFEISLITAVAKNRKPGINVRKAVSAKVTSGDLDGVYFSKSGRCDFYLANAAHRKSRPKKNFNPSCVFPN